MADELARLIALLVLFVVSLFIFHIHSSLFSDWRRTISSKFVVAQALSISTEELVLSGLRCNGHSLQLSSYLSRIGRILYAAPQLILHSLATNSLRRSLFGDSLSLYNLWSRPWKVSRLLGLHGVSSCSHRSKGG